MTGFGRVNMMELGEVSLGSLPIGSLDLVSVSFVPTCNSPPCPRALRPRLGTLRQEVDHTGYILLATPLSREALKQTLRVGLFVCHSVIGWCASMTQSCRSNRTVELADGDEQEVKQSLLPSLLSALSCWILLSACMYFLTLGRRASIICLLQRYLLGH
ncbi:hypothetical protein GALMADRAFT_271315 [Galerina marginata CBS 339.88]|uniref:Uncharacterized protein n=1 Tax=Galerina marginata (strain CBS 339.88) TaxID=685588 RepID=A0A067STY2_GALM3|nr:hypothetical protein GALMADRAFT_271315 [Galerina marginata CBS 339.88]